MCVCACVWGPGVPQRTVTGFVDIWAVNPNPKLRASFARRGQGIVRGFLQLQRKTTIPQLNKQQLFKITGRHHITNSLELDKRCPIYRQRCWEVYGNFLISNRSNCGLATGYWCTKTQVHTQLCLYKHVQPDCLSLSSFPIVHLTYPAAHTPWGWNCG